jgi:hypothetical protein
MIGVTKTRCDERGLDLSGLAVWGERMSNTGGGQHGNFGGVEAGRS